METVNVTGKYAVGTSCFSIEDGDRLEELGDLDCNRKVTVRMYYPVNPKEVRGRKRAKIFSDRKQEAIVKAYHMRKADCLNNQADYYENVPLSKDEKWPLLMFNHGYTSYVEANSFLCCEIASQGYIVASVGHAYEAIENDYADGSYDYYDKRINRKVVHPYVKGLIAQLKILKYKGTDEEKYAKFDAFQRKYSTFMMDRVREWAKDTINVVQHLHVRYPEEIDWECGVAASGHSFGGATAYYLCQYYYDFTCGINIDGALFGDYTGKIMEKPFYQISCKENVNVETRPFLQHNAPVYHAVFKDLKHIGFTDAKFFINKSFLVGKLDANIMHENLCACHLQFLDHYMKGKKNSVLGADSSHIIFSEK